MAYHGKQYKGAARDLKTHKREEAEARNAKTMVWDRASSRREAAAVAHAARVAQGVKEARNRSRRGRRSLEVTGY